MDAEVTKKRKLENGNKSPSEKKAKNPYMVDCFFLLFLLLLWSFPAWQVRNGW